MRNSDAEQYGPSSVSKSRPPTLPSQRTEDLSHTSARGHNEPVVSPSTKPPPVKSSAATHNTGNASPLPRQSGGTFSTTSPYDQAGPSRSALPHLDLRKAKQNRDAMLERRRKEAESMGRRRCSAMPEMRIRDTFTPVSSFSGFCMYQLSEGNQTSPVKVTKSLETIPGGSPNKTSMMAEHGKICWENLLQTVGKTLSLHSHRLERECLNKLSKTICPKTLGKKISMQGVPI